MPQPVSLTETKTLPCFSVVSTVMVESLLLNLIALSMRLYSTCWIFPISAQTYKVRDARISEMEIRFFVQVPSNEAAVSLMTALMSNEVRSSIFPLSSMSFSVSRLCVSLCSRSVSNRTIFRYFSCISGGIVPSRIAST